MFSMHKKYDFQFALYDKSGNRLSFETETGLKQNKVRKMFLDRFNDREKFLIKKDNKLWEIEKHRKYLRESNALNFDLLNRDSLASHVGALLRSFLDIDALTSEGKYIETELFYLKNDRVMSIQRRVIFDEI